MSQVFDSTICQLGEGLLWHPLRQQLFWFDILEHRLMTRKDGVTQFWQFDQCVSAAGWVDEDTFLIASASELFTFNVETGARNHVLPLEADNPATRSNDGRADPFGGFWIGSMGFNAEQGAGAIYRYYRGELRVLFPEISIPNAMCFDPNGQFALYCDTREHVIRKVALEQEHGWPLGPSEIFIDMRKDDWGPDGAVLDADGNLWNAHWNAGRVGVYNPKGEFLREFTFEASKTTCPAFGGPDLSDLFVTSAAEDLTAEELAARPESGMTFTAPTQARGQKEHKVIL
ncbi:SMP-30/gluconolactonase/LRE family protein [Aliiruegeria sabulilitoris]|uniref:SMP-30/gluconolactonase/LRE family protein n=1 Tax=Aliiruegeria sabulilitoris TaxID=1510458 RepID=UPI0008309FF6|nr:SMP-30/gluconolactonase/LRE family protein [Aliiruegeria sabulilitoris]NDR59169.1 SMP-30/gluconolactonase/LRE family protein [Pseudoruegeria sp. M32A2M]